MLVWETVLGALTYLRLRDNFENDLARRLISSARLLAHGVDGPLVTQFGPGDEALPVYRLAAQRLAEQVGAAGVERAYVIDRKLLTLLDSVSGARVGDVRYSVLANRPEVARAFEGEPIATRSYVDDEGRQRLSAFAALSGGGGPEAVLGVDASPDYFVALRELRRQILWFGAASLIVAVLVASYFLRSISARLARLRQAISQVTRGDFDVSLERGRADEIGGLGRDLDGLVASLVHRRDYYESVLGGLSVGLVAIDQAGLITGANQEGVKLVGSGPLVGRGVDEALAHEPALIAFVTEARAAERGATRELVLAARSPQSRQVAAVASPIVQAGQRTGLTLWLSDVTELRRLERRARTNERLAALGSMAAGLLHEIRNPLASLGTYVDLARHGLDKPRTADADTEIRDVLNRARAQSERLAHFLQDFQIVAGLRPLRLEQVSLSDVFARALDNLERPPNISLETNIDEHTIVHADERLLEHAFRNIVQNAYEAVRVSGQKVAISVTCRDRRAVIDVSDDGAGIAPAMLEKIFDPMTTTKPGGTGLGLTIVHRIIEAHGGTVEVTSVHGKGAAFQVVLPAFTNVADQDEVHGAHSDR